MINIFIVIICFGNSSKQNLLDCIHLIMNKVNIINLILKSTYIIFDKFTNIIMFNIVNVLYEKKKSYPYLT